MGEHLCLLRSTKPKDVRQDRNLCSSILSAHKTLGFTNQTISLPRLHACIVNQRMFQKTRCAIFVEIDVQSVISGTERPNNMLIYPVKVVAKGKWFSRENIQKMFGAWLFKELVS